MARKVDGHTVGVHGGAAETLQSRFLLGAVYERQSRFEEAAGLLTETLARRRELLGPVHPDTLSSMNELGMVYERVGRFSDAEGLHAEAFAGREQLFGKDHVNTAESLNNLASVYSQQGRQEDAERRRGEPEEVRVHDFLDQTLGKAIP